MTFLGSATAAPPSLTAPVHPKQKTPPERGLLLYGNALTDQLLPNSYLACT